MCCMDRTLAYQRPRKRSAGSVERQANRHERNENGPVEKLLIRAAKPVEAKTIVLKQRRKTSHDAGFATVDATFVRFFA